MTYLAVSQRALGETEDTRIETRLSHLARRPAERSVMSKDLENMEGFNYDQIKAFRDQSGLSSDDCFSYFSKFFSQSQEDLL